MNKIILIGLSLLLTANVYAADQKVSDLGAVNPANADTIYIIQGGVSSKATVSNLFAAGTDIEADGVLNSGISRTTHRHEGQVLGVTSLGATTVTANTISGNTIVGGYRIYAENYLGAGTQITCNSVSFNTIAPVSTNTILVGGAYTLPTYNPSSRMTLWNDGQGNVSWNTAAVYATGGGGGGTSDHSALTNLDYASASHTGFAADGDYMTGYSTETAQFGGLYATNISANTVTANTISGNTVYSTYVFANLVTAQTVSFNSVTSQVSIHSVIMSGAYKFPTWDGTAAQVMTTDGRGTVSWSTVTASGGGGTTHGYSLNLSPQAATLTNNTVVLISKASTVRVYKLIFPDDPSIEPNAVSWQFKMPATYSSDLTANIYYDVITQASVTMDFKAYVWAMSDGDSAHVDVESYDSVNSGTETSPATSGYPGYISITLTNADSVAAGDLVNFKLGRDGDSGNDGATGNVEVRAVELTWN